MSGIFAGHTDLDVFYYQDGYAAENKKTKTDDFMTAVGGPAANAAITYALLGGDAVLVTCIGKNRIGQMVRDILEGQFHIRVMDYAEPDEHAGISSISINTRTGSRTLVSGQTRFRCEKKAADGVWTFGDFCLFDCNLQELCLPGVQAARRMGAQIVLDAGSWKPNLETFFACADTVIASADCHPPKDWRAEAYLPLVGKLRPMRAQGAEDASSASARTAETAPQDPSDPDTALFFSAAALGAPECAVTHGGAAVTYREGAGKIRSVAPPQAEAVDTLGAGDVFHGAYCYFRYDRGETFAESLADAAEVAAMSVRYRGAREGVIRWRDRHETV